MAPQLGIDPRTPRHRHDAHLYHTIPTYEEISLLQIRCNGYSNQSVQRRISPLIKMAQNDELGTSYHVLISFLLIRR